ncbi:MAG: hypothetical protein U9N87_05215 [Planctomycetota bacterium]|nr:hypothetical protein [Planctomycetota bacterium]
MKRQIGTMITISILLLVGCWTTPTSAESYPIVDTGQERCYDNSRETR